MKFLEWMDLDRGIQKSLIYFLIRISKYNYKYEGIQEYDINIFQTYIKKRIISQTFYKIYDFI